MDAKKNDITETFENQKNLKQPQEKNKKIRPMGLHIALLACHVALESVYVYTLCSRLYHILAAVFMIHF